MDRQRIDEIFNNIASRKSIMVVGDVMLDHYIWGTVDRISPEAPVPVVNINKETYTLGGAGNVANNLSALGCDIFLVGVLGQDNESRKLQDILKEKHIYDRCIRTPSRRTIVKSRVIAHTQQVVRLDKEDREPVDSDLVDTFVRCIKEVYYSNIDGIIISDYNKGLITYDLVSFITGLVKTGNHKVWVGVDPKTRFSKYHNVDFITPNTKELSLGANIEIHNDDDLLMAGHKTMNITNCQNLLVTRGEHGMSLFEGGGTVTAIPSVARHVFDVTGAGDTVIAVYTLALCAGAVPLEAAKIANIAAGIVVGEVGAATVTLNQLYTVCVEDLYSD